MGYSDFTSTSVSSGPTRVTYNPMMILLFIAGSAGIYFLFKKRKDRIKSGIGLINFSISPRNEKFAIGLAIVALSMYGLDVYLKHKDPKKEDISQ